MAYLPIARRFRPQVFSDLLGQEHVARTLQNAVRLNRIANAYLFCGPRGVGKTTVARILAKSLRCLQLSDGVPCNQCSECTSINEGRSMDVQEIDGASHNGVEAVRAIRENTIYTASSGIRKIYIIDEVHMLSTSAFNALLKTLEEPPPHVTFIFATTEFQKIPLTILSRCQRFDFKRIGPSEITQRLKEILKGEGYSLEENALHLVSTYADGSVRDALSLLDQVIAFYGDKKEQLNEEQVAEALGIPSEGFSFQFLEAIAGDRKKALDCIEQVFEGGRDLKVFVDQVVELTRQVYLSKLLPDLPKEPRIQKLDQKFSKLWLERMLQIFLKASQTISWTNHPRAVVELAAMKSVDLEGLGEVQPQLEAEIPSASPEPAPVNWQTRWTAFVQHAIKKRPMIGSILSHSAFRFQEGEKGLELYLGFPKDSFYEAQLRDKKYFAEVESLLKEFFGMPIAILFETGEVGPSIEQMKDNELEMRKRAALENPELKKIQDILGAKVVGVQVQS